LGKNKIAVVTGGSSGIGYSIAEKFVLNNIRTVLIGRDISKLKTACGELGSLSDFLVCDLSDIKELPEIVERIIKKQGRIDILVNNAGINLKKPMLDISD